MPTSVVMPALEMAQETGKVVSWLKKEGEQVATGDMIIEIETDKAVVEIEALADGVLAGITAQVGDVIPVGQTIAWLLGPGESVPEGVAQVQTGRRTDAAASVVTIPVPAAATGEVGKGPRVSPKARRMAADLGVDLSSLRGSGPGGEILAEDVQAAAGTPSSAPAATTSGATEALSTVGRLMAERTTASWTTVPHFFVSREVDASVLNTTRARIGPVVEQASQVKVTHTDLLVGAVAHTLMKHPRLNASWASGAVALNADINVALAIAVDDAVVTAVIRGANRITVGEIATQRKELSARARAGRLQPLDISGATFTISNLGMFGVDAFTAIIVPPQAAILAVGAIADRVVAEAGAAVVRPYMTMTLSSDHRVVDGARAASFMADLVAALREPDTWLSY
jgi:pyruvate dehydrogenase E2 component (dihydrolipoamide acetyltransferase)